MIYEELRKNLRQFRARFDAEFKRRYRTRIRSTFAKSALTKRQLGVLERFVLRGGKRIRPFLMFCASEYSSKKSAYKNLWDFAVGIELVHAGMLIHDDIMDRSRTRRGKPTLHRILGRDQAITLGDIAWSLGYDFMLNARFPVQQKKRAIATFVEAAILTGEGQMLDLEYRTRKHISKIELYLMYTLKTATYSFAAPLVMGAILGGHHKQISFYRKLGIMMGIAFQLHDDILDKSREKQAVIKKTTISATDETVRLAQRIMHTILKSDLPKSSQAYLSVLTRYLNERST